MSLQSEQKAVEVVSAVANKLLRGVLDADKLVQFIQAVIKVLKEFREKTEDIVNGLKKDIVTLAKLTRDASADAKEAQRSAAASSREFKRGVEMLEKKIGEVRNAIPEEFDSADLQKQIEIIRAAIPKIPDIPEAFDATEILARLDELEKTVKEQDKRIRESRAARRGGSTMHRDHIKEIDISSQLNGSDKTFNVGAFYRIIAVDLSSFPYGALRKQIDYTYDGNAGEITFTSEITAGTQLAAGQTCIVTLIAI